MSDCFSIKCKYLELLKAEDKSVLGFYCNKLEHELENGYAVEYHSKQCGEIVGEKSKV